MANQQATNAERGRARRGSLTVAACALLIVAAASLAAARATAAGPQDGFADCAAALSYFRESALGAPLFIDLPPGWSEEQAEAYAASEASNPFGGAPASEAAQISLTDGFETAVFETDGRRIYALLPHALRVLELRGDQPEIVASLNLELGNGVQQAIPSRLILAGAKAFLFRLVRYDVPNELPNGGMEIIEVDISNPRRPNPIRTLSMFGGLVSARLDGTNLQLVISHNGVSDWWVWHEYDKALRWETNGDFGNWIRNSAIDVWLPHYALAEHPDSPSEWAPIVPCERVMPHDYVHDNGVTVLMSFDANRGLTQWGAIALADWPWQTHQIANAVYVADYRYLETHIHRFDLSGPDSTAHHGKVSVAGGLLWDEWFGRMSLSEHEGRLRVVTSNEDPLEEDGGWITSFAIETEGLRLLGITDQLDNITFHTDVHFLRERAYFGPGSVDVMDLSRVETATVLSQLNAGPYEGLQVFPLNDRFVLTVGNSHFTDRANDPIAAVSLFDLIDPQQPIKLGTVEVPRLDRKHEFDAWHFEYHDGVAIIPIGPRFYRSEEQWNVPRAVHIVGVRHDGPELLGTIETPSRLHNIVQVGSRHIIFTQNEVGGFDIAANRALDWTSYEHLTLHWRIRGGATDCGLSAWTPWREDAQLQPWSPLPIYWPLCFE